MKPGRTLLEAGAESCSDAELLAILLDSGGRGYSALDSANALLDKYFNALREAFTKTKAKTNLESLFWKKKNVSSRYRKSESLSQAIFELPEGRTASPACVMKDDGVG
jgi:DNA repair protein RadC